MAELNIPTEARTWFFHYATTVHNHEVEPALQKGCRIVMAAELRRLVASGEVDHHDDLLARAVELDPDGAR